MPALTRSTMSSSSASVASMFTISRSVDVEGSMPSEIERTCTPRPRSRFTVFRTSIRDRPSRSTRHTTTCIAVLGVVEELFQTGPLDRGLAFRGDVRDDVALLHPGSNERVKLQLRIPTRRTRTRITDKPYPPILTRKNSSRLLLRRNTARHLPETAGHPEPRSRHGPGAPRTRVSKSYWFPAGGTTHQAPRGRLIHRSTSSHRVRRHHLARIAIERVDLDSRVVVISFDRRSRPARDFFQRRTRRLNRGRGRR